MLSAERIKDGTIQDGKITTIPFLFPVEVPNRKKPQMYEAELHINTLDLGKSGLFIRTMQVTVKGKKK